VRGRRHYSPGYNHTHAMTLDMHGEDKVLADKKAMEEKDRMEAESAKGASDTKTSV